MIQNGQTKDTSVCKTIDINAPASIIWEVITAPVLMNQWMLDVAINISVEWKVGSPVRMWGDLHGISFENKGIVLQAEPCKVLRYSHWSSLSEQPDMPGNYGVITFTLTPAGNNTMLTFSQTNISPGATWQHVSFYWDTALALIKKISEMQ